ncbi:MAG: chorismate mutase [Vicinamibacterales bacterium]
MATEHAHQPSADSVEALVQCRADIDRVDAVLVALLRERARLAVRAGCIKVASGEPVVAPVREAAILERVRRLAGEPLDGEAMARIFRHIIDETRAAEQRRV